MRAHVGARRQRAGIAEHRRTADESTAERRRERRRAGGAGRRGEHRRRTGARQTHVVDGRRRREHRRRTSRRQTANDVARRRREHRRSAAAYRQSDVTGRRGEHRRRFRRRNRARAATLFGGEVMVERRETGYDRFEHARTSLRRLEERRRIRRRRSVLRVEKRVAVVKRRVSVPVVAVMTRRDLCAAAVATAGAVVRRHEVGTLMETDVAVQSVRLVHEGQRQIVTRRRRRRRRLDDVARLDVMFVMVVRQS